MKRIILVLAVFLSLISLSGCLPARQMILGAINQVGRADDGTSVVLTSEGIGFSPVGLKQGVVLNVIGDSLTVSDERCTAVEVVDGIAASDCLLGNVEALTVVQVTGVNRAVTASWIQENETFARGVIVSEKK